jgi:hypothetical protein
MPINSARAPVTGHVNRIANYDSHTKRMYKQHEGVIIRDRN